MNKWLKAPDKPGLWAYARPVSGTEIVTQSAIDNGRYYHDCLYYYMGEVPELPVPNVADHAVVEAAKQFVKSMDYKLYSAEESYAMLKVIVDKAL